jgi:hypothetical protein
MITLVTVPGLETMDRSRDGGEASDDPSPLVPGRVIQVDLLHALLRFWCRPRI